MSTNDINMYVVEQLQAFPTTNIKSKGKTEDLEGAKVKLESIAAVSKESVTIHSDFDHQVPSVVRDWIHVIKDTHPLVNNNIKDLDYFKPISEEVGSRILAYKPDLSSLELKDWNSTKPEPIRTILKQKLDADTVKNISSSYNALNDRQVFNMSNEFFKERDRSATMTSQGRTNIESHDFHLAGDTSYSEINIKETSSDVSNALHKFFKGAIRLINYLYSVSNLGTASNAKIIDTVEKKDILINLKGDPIQTPASVIDNSVLKPKTTNL